MDMLLCNLNRSSDMPLYEQLYHYIKKEIIEGRLEYGTKLPSKRKLAEFLKISQNTVEAAYEQLAAEGYIESRPRKGYFVLAYEDLEYIQNDKFSNKNKRKKEHYKFDFHPSNVDTKNFPFAKWRKYAKMIIDEQNHHLLKLGDPQGEYELREEIANYLYQARGAHTDPNNIIIGAGVEILLQQLLLLFEKDTVYGVEDPGYHIIYKMLESNMNKVYPLEVDGKGVKTDPLEKSNIDVVYVTPSHHFPYGTVLTVNRRMKLLNWAYAKKDRFIIEDDYDSEFRYSGKTIPSLLSMDGAGKVIYLGSFSKSLMPSIRISYMVLPEILLKKYKEKLSFYHSSVSRIDQKILTEFMKQGDFERHLNRMRKLYRRKLEKLENILKPYKEIKLIGEQSGLHVVLEVHNGMDEQELARKAEKASLKIYPISSYSLKYKNEKPAKIVLGFAGIEEELLETAIVELLNSWGLEKNKKQ